MKKFMLLLLLTNNIANAEHWEIFNKEHDIQRMSIYGGWIIRDKCAEGLGLLFIADPNHLWVISQE